MSFVSSIGGGFKKIGGGLKKIGSVADDALSIGVPILKVVNPGLGELAERAQALVVAAEVQHTDPKSGSLRAEAVKGDLLASLNLTREILDRQGKQLVVDDAKLDSAIAHQVAFLNELEDFLTTAHIADKSELPLGVPL